MLDEDKSASIEKSEILDFIEQMGPSRAEMSAQVENSWAKFDIDGSGSLEYDEFILLLEEMDRGYLTLMNRLKSDKLFYASCLVVLASLAAILSALLQALLDGEKRNGEVDVPPYYLAPSIWKSMDYPKVGIVWS